MSKAKLNRRLSSMDAAFLYTEHPTAPMHIGGVDTLDGPVSLARFREELDAKLAFIPRYRQRLVLAPLNIGHPTWEDDPKFDIKNHVVGVTLPSPGTEEQLKKTAGKLFEGMLDRDKPLWKIYLIDGLKDGRSALVSLVHHCMVDGVSGAELLSVILDPSPTPQPVEKQPFEPTPIPEPGKLFVEAVWDTLGEQIDNWSEMQRNMLRMARTIRAGQALPLVRELPGLVRDFAKPVKKLPFNSRNFSGKRKLSWSSVSFAEARAIRGQCGGTVNDVVLAALGGAVRRYMESHNLKTHKQNLRVMVPVSLRSEDQRGSMGNQVSMLPVDVPLGFKDPVKRLQAITERTTILKKARTAEGLNLMMHLWQGAPPAMQALLGSAVFAPSVQTVLGVALFSPGLHMVCTNVPGPQIPLYSQGRKVLAHYPLLPVAPGMGLNLGVFSYNHRIHFGLIADANVAPDVDKFNHFLDQSFVELRKAAGIEELEPIEIRHTRLKRKSDVPVKKAATNGRAARKKTASPASETIQETA